MKKAYRILAILLCLSMLFALAACSAKQENTTEDQKPDETATETTDTAEPSGDAPASEEAPEEMTLSVAWWGGAARNERIEKTLDLYSELNPNVSFSTATNNFSDHYTAMATAAASSDLPDMWLVQTQLWLNQFVSSDQLLDLTPYIESGALDISKIPEAVLAGGRASDGKIYAIGASYNSPALQYNKSALDAAGITVVCIPIHAVFSCSCDNSESKLNDGKSISHGCFTIILLSLQSSGSSPRRFIFSYTL